VADATALESLVFTMLALALAFSAFVTTGPHLRPASSLAGSRVLLAARTLRTTSSMASETKGVHYSLGETPCSSERKEWMEELTPQEWIKINKHDIFHRDAEREVQIKLKREELVMAMVRRDVMGRRDDMAMASRGQGHGWAKEIKELDAEIEKKAEKIRELESERWAELWTKAKAEELHHLEINELKLEARELTLEDSMISAKYAPCLNCASRRLSVFY
jgi:hypothetical protein